MFMWFTISLRNILKNGRRSLTTILAIALGFGAINLFQGYVHSTYQGLTNAAIHGVGSGTSDDLQERVPGHGEAPS